jgi:hypothetical protein
MDPARTTDCAPAKRRWFRFSLRTLLAAFTVVAILFGWVAWRLERARHDQQVLADLSPFSSVSYNMPMSSPGRLKTMWVMEHFSRVDGVEFVFVPHMPQEKLKHLIGLPRLEKLKIKSDAITDDGLKHLLGIKRLRILGIASSQLTDAGLLTLGEMKQLQVLAVSSPKLTAEGIERLKRDLPNCQTKSFEMIDVVLDE